MRKGLDKREVESLAKTMEIKFSVAGPPIGGAKSGINFDPNDPRKKDVLKRWYKAVLPLLKNYYGTGGDLNVDEVHEVIPITESFGLWHPQEGIVQGHFGPATGEKVKKIGQLRFGVSKQVEDLTFTPDPGKFLVADLITGFGVAEAVKHYYNLYGGEVKGKKAIIQGWGNVASAAAWYLAGYGVKITGIIDREGGLINPDGFTADEITTLFRNKQGNKLVADNLISYADINERIWSSGAEIFIPAAASRLITREQSDSMIKNGLEVISCGANVPFADKEIFMGPIAEYVDEKVSVIPDFIANCGMARVFGYLMQNDVDLSDQGIFNDVSTTIRLAMERVRQVQSSTKNISKTGLQIALEQLVKE